MDRVASYKLDNGVEYDVILPANINSETQVIVYSCIPDNISGNLSDSIIDSDINAIVLLPKEYWSSTYPNDVFEMLNNVSNIYSVNTDNYIANGFSQPAFSALKTKINYIQNNPGCDRQIVFLNDGVPLQRDSYIDLLSDADVKVLEGNNTFIVDYCQANKWQNLGSKLLDSDLDILFISDKELPYNDFWANHDYVYYSSYKNGLYRSLISFIYEGGDLPEDGFIYRIYNHDTHQLEEYTAKEVKEWFNLSSDDFRNLQRNNLISEYEKKRSYISQVDFMSLFANAYADCDDEVKSDLYYTKELIENIMNSVTNYNENLESGLLGNDFQSTTLIPSQLSLMMERYSLANIDLIYKLTKLLESAINISLKYYNIDKKISEEVNELDEGTQQQENGGNSVTISPVNEPSGTILPIVDDYENDEKNGGIINVSSSNNSNLKTETLFLKYDELYSDDNKIVFEGEDNYKIVVYKDGNDVLGIEYYYNYENNDDAILAYESFKEQFDSNIDVSKIDLNDNVVRIIYNEETFKNMSVDDVRKKFAYLNEI